MLNSITNKYKNILDDCFENLKIEDSVDKIKNSYINPTKYRISKQLSLPVLVVLLIWK